MNKFLYSNGGSEKYIFDIGKQLTEFGHVVQFFGMEHPDNVVGNEVGEYTSNMDFHTGSIISKIIAPFKIVYSTESRRKIRKVLDDFEPDIIHLNNINFQITPSIILEIRKWNKTADDKQRKVKIVSTIHDPQWICPNHMMINGCSGKGCDKCFDGHYYACIKNKCIHNSGLRSILGALEARLYRALHVYKKVDLVICPSLFMKSTMDRNKDIVGRTVMLRNYIDVKRPSLQDIVETRKKIAIGDNERYVLYFGRYSEEKGIHTLIKATSILKDIKFVFAGSGPFEEEINSISNIINLGYLSGKDLYSVIAGAYVTLIASECYENCPFSVMESLSLGVPVLGADIGGIPELVMPMEINPMGELFESGNVNNLVDKILYLWENADIRDRYANNCRQVSFDSLCEYTNKLLRLYSEY